jgi:hypothetical protein
MTGDLPVRDVGPLGADAPDISLRNQSIMGVGPRLLSEGTVPQRELTREGHSNRIRRREGDLLGQSVDACFRSWRRYRELRAGALHTRREAGYLCGRLG